MEMDGDENDEFEIPHKVDSIVERLYAPPESRHSSSARDRRDEAKASTGENEKSRVSSATTQSVSGEDSDDDDDNGKGLDPYGGLFDDEQKKILEIKEQIEESDQSEEALVELLQSCGHGYNVSDFFEEFYVDSLICLCFLRFEGSLIRLCLYRRWISVDIYIAFSL